MNRKRKILKWTLAVVLLLAAVTIGGSFYMLSFSLSPDADRRDTAAAWARLYERVPDMKPWVDSLNRHHLLCDTTITAADGRRLHALYLRCDTASGRTAVIVHGYKDSSVKFLYLGRMYHRDLGCNILLPDLSAHGLSDGDVIQMGWNDRLDVMQWLGVAKQIFETGQSDSARIVVHGVSMGAATTMCVSGEELPPYVECFVEDCGYTSVWDEFAGQLREQFSLPSFPLMWTTSVLCKVRYGWTFGEASPLKQVAKCRRPMLFIHGDKDTFVPTAMVYPLYGAKPQPKRLWIAPGSEHARSYLDHREEYTEQVRSFLSESMK